MSNYLDFNEQFATKKNMSKNQKASEQSMKVVDKNIYNKIHVKMSGERNSIGGISKAKNDQSPMYIMKGTD